MVYTVNVAHEFKKYPKKINFKIHELNVFKVWILYSRKYHYKINPKHYDSFAVHKENNCYKVTNILTPGGTFPKGMELIREL